MFDNMSQREKIMAMAVGGLTPLLLLFFGWSSLSTKFTKQEVTLFEKRQELRNLEKQKWLGQLATVRYENYRKRSLPSDAGTSVTQYQLWLQELVESVGIEDFSVDVKNRNAAEGIAGADPRNPVAGRFRFELSRCICTLEQLANLIYGFNQENILHQIKDLAVTANYDGTAARSTPTGWLTIRMTVEVICMRDADSEREFENDIATSSLRSLVEYHNVVTRRDLFGLPNNQPDIKGSTSYEFEVGKNVVIDLKVDDDDEDQSLTPLIFDIVSEPKDENAAFDDSCADFVDGTIEMDDDGTVRLGRLPEGEYEFKVRVTDNGWPNLTIEKSVRIEVFEQQVEVAVERPEANDTTISGIVTYKGETRVWIRIKPQGKVLKLVVGDSFELDAKTWTIKRIGNSFVVIECDGKDMKYPAGHALSDPEPVKTVSATAG